MTALVTWLFTNKQRERERHVLFGIRFLRLTLADIRSMSEMKFLGPHDVDEEWFVERYSMFGRYPVSVQVPERHP